MKLWLVRHAKVLVGTGVCYGATDVEADPEATAQAAKNFAKRPASNALLWTSPASRTQQLAQSIHALRQDLQGPTLDTRLQEFNFGSFEMQHWDTIPKASIDNWTADFANHRFGGKDCVANILTRVTAALQSALATQAPEIVWITHAGVINAIRLIHDINTHPTPNPINAKNWSPTPIAPGQWQTIELNRLLNQPLNLEKTRSILGTFE